MATNVLTPQGLLQATNAIGGAPTYQLSKYKIKNGYGTKIGVGDLVRTGTSGNQGYVTLSALNDVSYMGVFVTVYPYFDTTFQQIAHGLNGSYVATAAPPSGVDIDCAVIDDPFAVFRAQVSGGPWSESWRGQNINWLTATNGAPNGAGISTLALDAASINTSNTLPLRIMGVAGVPGGPQDPANTNPWILVRFNPAIIEALQGTGI